MSRRTAAKAKGLGALPENTRIEGTRQTVANLVHQAIKRRVADLEHLRELVSQIDTASPFLIERFAAEADESMYSDLALKFVSDSFGYLDESRLEPWRQSDPSCLDAFLHHHITKNQLRRAG
jgi:hypothetical protein